MSVIVGRASFSEAVEKMLIVAMSAKDAEGNTVAYRISPFRMMLEMRDALQRAAGPVKVEIEGWQEMIRPMQPPFPGALRTVLEAGAAAHEEDDGA